MAIVDICRLSFEKAVKALEVCKKNGCTTVMYKSGVWNPYKSISIDTAIEVARKGGSGYGVSVMMDDQDGTVYVKNPCASDMW